MGNEMELRQLARALYSHRMNQEDVACVLLRADSTGKTRWMMEWLDKNPKAKPSEICRISMEILREKPQTEWKCNHFDDDEKRRVWF